MVFRVRLGRDVVPLIRTAALASAFRIRARYSSDGLFVQMTFDRSLQRSFCQFHFRSLCSRRAYDGHNIIVRSPFVFIIIRKNRCCTISKISRGEIVYCNFIINHNQTIISSRVVVTLVLILSL